MIRAAVIGDPVTQSLSPLIHNTWLAQHGIAGSYEAIAITPERLEQDVCALADRGYAGFNVTLPHKETIMRLCADIDPVARAIGAVNTVRIRDGKLSGRNTDAFGFMENLRSQCPEFVAAAGPAVVLGAGGAARAVVYALLEAGVPDVMIANRTAARAEILAASAFCGGRVRVVDWPGAQAALGQCTLLVNTTSLGMTGKDTLVFSLARAAKKMVVYDIVYRPLWTGLLLQARSQGLACVTGLGMLLHQARPAFEGWFGIMPGVDRTLEEKLEKAAA